ncbi:MAG: hypothetical protein JZU64_00620 [Rhodoferax sp.]|nr:hypothetical protein [Rhodoferax sp.]
MKKPVPYNTGKVLIGSHYEHRQHYTQQGQDMERLQSALLNGKRPLWERLADYALAVVIGVSLAALLVVGLSS